LKEKPGEWALVGTMATPGTAHSTRVYILKKGFGQKGYEVKQRGRDVYARYVGPRTMPVGE
jgi:hypothetical protein